MTGSARLRSARPLFALVLPVAALGSATLASLGGAEAHAAEGPPAVYAVDVVLAPVCLEGSFPVTVTTPTGAVAGTLTVDTTAKGRLRGTLDLGGTTFAISGSVSHTAKNGGVVRFLARAGKTMRISFVGRLEGTAFNGTAQGRGPVTPGRNPFTLDVSGASPQTATIQFSVADGRRNRVAGTGVVTACGESLNLRVGGSRGAALRLDLRGRRIFRFRVVGTDDGTGLVAAWTSKGFGVSTAGEGLLLPTLDVPAGLVPSVASAEFEVEDPVVPITFSATNPRGTFSLAPALPAGMTFDAATGTIAGTPTEVRPVATYTVTARNFAGTATAPVDIQTRTNRAYSFERETRVLSAEDARHFLQRTRFGVTAADEVAVMAPGGFDAMLDGMLAFQSGTAVETAALAELVNTDVNLPPELIHKFPSSAQVARWWNYLMVNNPNPLQEILAFFWHDHFAVSSENMSGSQLYYMVDYVNLYRHRGNGNLRDLLVAMARDPAMLYYLDGFRNTARAPNENFGREFWELFTLGVDNGYTQDDIVAVSKAWSGWRERSQTYPSPIVPTTTYTLNYMQFDPNRHDVNPKYFLGVTIPGQNVTDDYEAVVDATLANRPVAEFVVGKLFEHFCYDDPPAALVTEMADGLRAANYDMAAFLGDLFRSEAFYSSRSRRSRVKNPVEFGVGFMRTTGLRIRTSTLDSGLATLGQRPTQPPTVNGWPLGSLWLSSQQMADRTNLATTIVEDTGDQGGIAGSELMPAMPPVGQRMPIDVVRHFASLLRVELTPADEIALVDYLNSTRNTNGTLNFNVPFDGNLGTHIDERVRGLLLILVQHPTYHLR